MTDQTDTPQPRCPWCKHAAHHPGTECEAGVEHGPKHWHRCLCLNLVGADHACHPQMTCQGGTLGYSDAWHAQRRDAARTASGQQPERTPCSFPVCDDGPGEPCARHEREESHADGEHELCGTECPAVGQPVKVRVVSTRPEPVALTNDAQDLMQAAVGQPAEAHDTDEARPPRVQWRVEGYDADQWNPLGSYSRDHRDALQRQAQTQRRHPDMPTRLVRETTTWTVETEEARS